MFTEKKTVFITSALPYINGVKHLGNLIGSMLPADFYARVSRLQGKETLYICATDEHGTPAELAAAAQNLTPAEFCERAHTVQKDLCERFGMSWDYFGRSSSPANHELTQYFQDKLNENGLIEERATDQVYSVDEARFLPDRYVVGTCPHCNYDKARGDQCENCTRVLDPADLIKPRSAVSGSENIEIRSSKHLFLKQSQYTERLRDFITEKEKAGWTNLPVSIAKKWLDEGLHDRGITRDLQWGVPVNRPGFENKVFYVWFDAPIAYIAATKEHIERTDKDPKAWRRFWRKNDGADDVFYLQFMAKDNIPFHTVSFPITLLGAGEDWKPVDYIKGFNWLTYYGGKFSTSSKRGVFMNDALEVTDADYWRWHLLSNAPENSDSAFTWEDFQISINKDLADTLGNFVNRIARFAHAKFGETLPDRAKSLGEHEQAAFEKLQAKIKLYFEAINGFEIRKAANELRGIWFAGNEYLQIAAPWTVYKTDPEKSGESVNFAFHMIGLFASLSKPFIPNLAEKIASVLPGISFDEVWKQNQSFDFSNQIPEKFQFNLPPILVEKAEDETVTEWKSRFSGVEN